MRTKAIYTDEELAIVEAVENDEYVSLPKDEFEILKKSLKTATAETIKQRSKRKAMALNEGIPYQTYITHIIHKVTTARILRVNLS